MARKTSNVYPTFESKFKCIDTFRNFTQGLEYKITGFGNDFIGAEKVNVWWVTCLDPDEDQKPVSIIKTTLNKLFDRGILAEV